MAKLLQACFSSIIAIGLKGKGLMVSSYGRFTLARKSKPGAAFVRESSGPMSIALKSDPCL